MNPAIELLDSEHACRELGVLRATLYSYVSRGRIRCVKRAGLKTRMYLAEDVRKVAAQSAARRGHAPVAAGALSWGEPVLDTALTSVGPRGIFYRGENVLDLVARDTRFESVADRLWGSEPDERWPDRVPLLPVSSRLRLLPCLIEAVTVLGREPRVGEAPPQTRARGRQLVRTLAGSAVGSATRGNIAEHFAPHLAPRAGSARHERVRAALDAALVLCLDHELNASTFAARVAASTGADLVHCVGAALFVFTGPRHGGASERVEAFLDGLPARPKDQRAAIEKRLSRGEALPGFGHPLYPKGDPRAAPLLALARSFDGEGRADEVARLVAESSGELPNLDFGLVALARALGAPPETATLLFAIGRSAGWVAHVLEQRTSGALLRPRARYVGVPPA